MLVSRYFAEEGNTELKSLTCNYLRTTEFHCKKVLTETLKKKQNHWHVVLEKFIYSSNTNEFRLLIFVGKQTLLSFRQFKIRISTALPADNWKLHSLRQLCYQCPSRSKISGKVFPFSNGSRNSCLSSVSKCRRICQLLLCYFCLY